MELLTATMTPQVQQPCKFTPVTLMSLSLGHIGSWFVGKDEGEESRGERKDKTSTLSIVGPSVLFEQPLCLDRLQELCNFQHLLHIKELLEELFKL